MNTADQHIGVVWGIGHPGPGPIGCPYCIDTLRQPVPVGAQPTAQPTADEAEGDEREALAWLIHCASGCGRYPTPGGISNDVCLPDVEDYRAADAVLAAGFCRRDADAGLRERVEAELTNAEDQPDWVDRDGEAWVEVAVIRAALANTPPAPERNGGGES